MFLSMFVFGLFVYFHVHCKDGFLDEMSVSNGSYIYVMVQLVSHTPKLERKEL